MGSILSVTSGPGREAGLNRALASVFLRNGKPICDRAVVGWEESRDVTKALASRWAPFPVAWKPARFYGALDLARNVATANPDDTVFWIRDDEVVVDVHPDVCVAGVSRPTRVVVVQDTVPAPEIRVFRHPFAWPEWARPSLLNVGWGWEDNADPVLDGIRVRRERFAAPAGGGLRINVGAGPRWASAWTNIDHDPAFCPDVKLELGVDPMPFAAESVAAVYGSHMFDHMDVIHGQRFLADCRRVMAPGAPIRLSVCDLAAFVAAYAAGDMDRFAYLQPPIYREFKTQGAKLGIIACGALAGREWYTGHRQLYDGPALCEALEMAGFVDATEYGERNRHPLFWDVDDIFPDHSAYVEAVAS